MKRTILTAIASATLLASAEAQLTVSPFAVPANVQKTTLGSAAASISFTVPAGYNNLRLTFQGRTDAATTSDVLTLRFNSDSGANYVWLKTQGNTLGSTTSTFTSTSATGAEIGGVPGATTGAGPGGIVTAIVPNYSGTTFWKNITGIKGTVDGSDYYSATHVAWWKNTAAITSITLSPGSGNFTAGTTATLTAQ